LQKKQVKFISVRSYTLKLEYSFKIFAVKLPGALELHLILPGKCKAGLCEPFCVTKGMQPCLCTKNKADLCMRCCAPLDVTGKNMTKLCKPYTDSSIPTPQQLPDNSTCSLGYCKQVRKADV